jgi:transcriptional regulator of NAD metabolism
MRESDAKMTHNEFTHKVVGFNRTRSSIEVKRQESATDIGSNSIDHDAKMTHNEFTHKVVGFNRTRSSIEVKRPRTRQRLNKQKNNKAKNQFVNRQQPKTRPIKK